MMKLCVLFTTSHSDTLGNACRLEMVKYLSQQFDSTIITNQVQFIKSLFPDENIIPITLKNNNIIPILSDHRCWKYLAVKINSIPADGVFMFHDDSLATIWIKYPVFHYVHQYGQRSEFTGNRLKAIAKSILSRTRNHLTMLGLKKSRMNFVVSRPIMELLRSKGINNLELTPHGMDLKKYQMPMLSEAHQALQDHKGKGYFQITYTGWVTENRGFQLMMDSLKEAAQLDEKIILVIAGADDYFSARIKEFARQNGLKDNIVNFGVVDASLIPGILHLSDVCLSFLDADVPAYRISPPQKVVEYFAAGKPVICNKIETHEWLVEHEKNGFILDPEPKVVAEHILKLKNDKQLYSKMSDNALKTADQYDIDKIYGGMVQVIRDSLNE